jgi:outer membrane lipoprotein-sorting protein
MDKYGRTNRWGNTRVKRIFLFFGVVVLAAPLSFSQDIRTAPEFFATVAERYSSISDYIAEVEMTMPEQSLTGTLFYRRPNLIRIDFAEPEDQVLVSDGETLKVYIPEYNVVLQQALTGAGENAVAGLASSDGLKLMRENYSIAYLDSPDPVPLDDPEDGESADTAGGESSQMVTKLRLTWRSTSEGFRQLILSIDEDRLIRRIVGVTVGYEEIQIDFLDVRLNQNIPTARFDYEAPASANLFSDFLFEQDG